jgi:hypothetical protein
MILLSSIPRDYKLIEFGLMKDPHSGQRMWLWTFNERLQKELG